MQDAQETRVRSLDPTPGLGRSPEGGNGNLLQYSCLEDLPMDRGAWQAVVHGVTKSWTGLKHTACSVYLIPFSGRIPLSLLHPVVGFVLGMGLFHM